jgi:hypothetical protein
MKGERDMVVNKKVTGKAISMPFGLAIGLTVCIAITLIVAGISANLILNQRIGEGAIGYCALLALLLASSAGAWMAAVLVKRRWMIVCMVVGGCYFLTLLGVTALFFGGQYQGIGATALTILGGSGCVGLLGIRAGNSGRKRHKKYRSR